MSEAANYFWIKNQADGTKKVGLSDSGLDDLGKINFIDYPEVGTKLTEDGTFISVEAEKAVSDLPSPVAGEVVAVNETLEDGPDALNSGTTSDRWIVTTK